MKKFITKLENTLMLDKLTKRQKIYLFTTPLVILLLGLISHDTPTNILIGVTGMWYTAFYAVAGCKSWVMLLPHANW